MIEFILAVLFISQVSSDAIDDLRQEGLKNLTALSNAAEAKILVVTDTLNETTLYISHATTVFSNDAQNITLTGQIEINATAEDLTLQAILDNRPASVLTCISNKQNSGYQKIQSLFNAFDTKLKKDATAHDSDFAAIASTVALTVSQLENVFNKQAEYISTCVELLCVENNLNTASKQYDNLISNISSLLNNLSQYRREFNNNAIPDFYALRNDVTSNRDASFKAMNKCVK